MKLTPTPLSGLYEASTEIRADSRGAFGRLFCDQDLEQAHQGRPIAQINYSFTEHRGSLRGMHYQSPPHSEAKWVRCVQGKVFDVALDLRENSPTFLQWHSVVLDSAQHNAIFIPEGFAHGFQTLDDNCLLLYLHSKHYAPGHEAAVRWDDPRTNIDWPMPPTHLSDRDKSHTYLTSDFKGVRL